jgi:hypothetical protein
VGNLSEEEPISLQVVNNTDRTVNVTNAQTNQTVATVPGKLVEVAFTVKGVPNRLSAVALLVLNGTTGYAIFYPNQLFAAESDQQPSGPVQKILDSFEKMHVLILHYLYESHMPLNS